MQEASLYQKYRPAKFKDVLGQDHIVKTLQGALKEKHAGHAYLFVGSRGTGKTSVARILAKELGASDADIHEIDAASYTGVDNIRALREEAAVMPFESEKKVYIVDEVHMLSKSAFNAFLKLLEEPPSHVSFILATTELEKVPGTIQSRCQIFTFKKPTQKVLVEMIARIAKAEGFTLEPASADLISLLADGSFRDGLSILQKILASSSDKKVSLAEVELVTGAPKTELIHRVIAGVAKGESASALSAVGEAVVANADMGIFAMLLVERVRILLMLRYSPEFGKELAMELTDSDREALEAFAKEKDSKVNSETLRKFIIASIETARSPLPQLPLELAILELSVPSKVS
ncbi:DNA polymerase III subunit gamma/tau [Candidatus Kaiserbacteria bacterium]|nr:DNA polymerase III subunit gamma/tau [Candidatus Kaiserbacteria bacterium]